ncbi:reverse transcriptase domain-containing protein [Bosea sp. NPDC055594]
MHFDEAGIKAERARRKIRSAQVNGRQRALASALRSYVRNRAVAYEAAYRELGPHAELDIIVTAVSRLNLFAPDTSPIFFWRVQKRRGGCRVVHRLTLHGRMRQIILKDAIECSFQPNEHLFLIKTRGRDREARLILDALRSGYRFGVRADIRDAFQNANALSALRNTPLPKSVIRNNLVYDGRQFIHDWRKEAGAGYAHRQTYYNIPSGGSAGLIQGAATSSVIFAVLLNDMPEAFSMDIRLFVYGDDILVLARNEDERAAARAILERYILTHPAGSFRMVVQDVDARRGFDLIGYGFRPSIMAEQIEIVPDTRQILATQDRLRLLVEMNIHRGWDPKKGGTVALRNTKRGWPAVSDLEDFHEDMLLWMDVEGEAYRKALVKGLRDAN